MIYEELKIQLDLNDPIDVLKAIGKNTDNNDWFVICDEGDCHLFNNDGNEIEINKIKILHNYLIPKNIKKIIIPNSIESIEKCTFHSCINLESITIPDSVESIGNYAFSACINLTSISIPDSVKSIEISTFADCKSLTSIVIPDSIKYIGYNVFYACRNLKSLMFKGKTIDQVKSMEYYPFGIKDESVIKCIN